MKVSEIQLQQIAKQIREEFEYIAESDKVLLEAERVASIAYVKTYTGLTDTQMDEHEDLSIAVLCLISDMYDNRQMYVDKSNVNRVVDTILSMYSVNLI